MGYVSTSFTPEQRAEITKALEQRGAVQPCPRCGNGSFGLLDGYFNQTIQTVLQGLVIGGETVPTIVVYCTRCGYLAQHALKLLGLSWVRSTSQEAQR